VCHACLRRRCVSGGKGTGWSWLEEAKTQQTPRRVWGVGAAVEAPTVLALVAALALALALPMVALPTHHQPLARFGARHCISSARQSAPSVFEPCCPRPLGRWCLCTRFEHNQPPPPPPPLPPPPPPPPPQHLAWQVETAVVLLLVVAALVVLAAVHRRRPSPKPCLLCRRRGRLRPRHGGAFPAWIVACSPPSKPFTSRHPRPAHPLPVGARWWIATRTPAS